MSVAKELVFIGLISSLVKFRISTSSIGEEKIYFNFGIWNVTIFSYIDLDFCNLYCVLDYCKTLSEKPSNKKEK